MTADGPPESLIARLLELPPRERAEQVQRVCEQHPEWRPQLAAFASLIDPSAPPTPRSDRERARALELAFAPRNESASTTIGPYKVLQEIGEGGFGVVWMAEQHSPLRRRVALKILKGGMDTREVISRFEAERQALALMDHPHIARVFDAGETQLGRPFFVMELVRGVPITRYCDDRRLLIEERLKLFIAVCQAMQHAHQKGIIHRDLKPSNILVTLHDGVAVPKIIDFGIAKATQGPLTEKTLFTQFHAFIGTPAYTSPEQMEMSGLDVDTRSDIYSLGVLLYELLAGRPPFESDKLLKSGLEAMRRTIRDVDPPRPSHRVGTLTAGERHTLAQQRHTDAGKLPLLLRGDLDWIVMHCLEKDRARRYATANDLASDIRHFLAHEPVEARPPSTAYRLAKFVHRHRVAVAAGVCVALALVASTIVSTVAHLRETAARRREHALNVEVAAAGARSQQIARFIKEMLSGVDPAVAHGRDNAVLHEILDSTTRRIDAELHDQPEVAAELRVTLASVYWSIGDFSKAEKLVLLGLPVIRAARPLRSVDLSQALHLLGRVLISTGRRTEAKPHVEEALALLDNQYGRRNLATAEVLFTFAKFVEEDPPKFRAIRQEVFDIYSELLPPEDPRLGNAIFGLATATLANNDPTLSYDLLQKALRYRTRALGPNHPLIGETWQSLGLCAITLNRTDEAISAFRNALNLRRRVLGDAHPEVISTLLRLTGLKSAVAEDSAVVEATDAVIAALRADQPRKGPELAIALSIRATFTEFRERAPERANALRTEALQHLSFALREGVPVEHRLRGDIRLSAQLKFSHGFPFETTGLWSLLIPLYRTSPQPNEREQELMTALWFHGLSSYWCGRFADANDNFGECITQTSGAKAGPMRRQLNHAIWSDSLLAVGRVDEAWAVLEPYLAELRSDVSQNPGEPAISSPVSYQIGRRALQRGDLVQAEAAFQRARKNADALLRFPELLSQYSFPAERFESALARLYAAQGRFDEAEELCRTARARMETPRKKGVPPPLHVVGEIHANLAEASDLARAAGRPEFFPPTSAKTAVLTDTP